MKTMHGFDDNDYPLEFDIDGIITETEAAWLVLIENEEKWFPKSQCRIEGGVLFVPEWLAKKQDLA